MKRLLGSLIVTTGLALSACSSSGVDEAEVERLQDIIDIDPSWEICRNSHVISYEFSAEAIIERSSTLTDSDHGALAEAIRRSCEGE